MKLKALIFLFFAIFASASISAQEHAVSKKFRFFVGYDGVKTESIAMEAQVKLAALPGVTEVNMNWPHYQLTFVVTSANIEENNTFAAVKDIFNAFGIGITTINREDEP